MLHLALLLPTRVAAIAAAAVAAVLPFVPCVRLHTLRVVLRCAGYR